MTHPLFYSGRMFSIEEIIDIAVHLEENGESFYRKAAESHADPEIVVKLAWLADEEAAHAERFKAMKQYVKIDVEDPSLKDMGQKLFRQAVGEQGFSLSDEGLSKVRRIKELLELAVEFEQDTIIFYEMLRSFIQETPVVQQLDQVIAEEHGHVKHLKGILTEDMP
jgi:rubrerythrin